VYDYMRQIIFGFFFCLQFTADLLEAWVNMADVFAELWPTDSTPRILLRILVHYNFGSGVRSNEAEKCRVVSEFCDTVLRENALRALAKDPPLSYRQAKERWVDVTEQYTSNLFGFRDNRQDARQFGATAQPGAGRGSAGGGNNNLPTFGRGAAQQGGAGRGRGGIQSRNRNARIVISGKSYPVCFDFNRASCNRKQSGCGCEDAKGSVFAHACNYYNYNNSKFCLAAHTRVGNH
jgi:hypothetical protein